ncbi:glutamate racemase [Bombilactobacillus bombi]|uniref:Glutamate racemase n=1 Tax=Bombilactobacillus bombi TaxID=1303590 RepID=A0A3R6W5C9_9LACO|nr:glutamate racemase [Bombilactobacillus bombi]RHW44151.1 glutamate racemase [Bombilactobacillus bombi]
MNNRPIGLLDSGVGGLTVVKQILRRLPHESTIFIGDQARLPYGIKTPPEIINFARQLVRFLISKNAKMIVIACNTATAAALPTLRREFNLPIIGVIASGSQAAVKQTKNQRVAVIATPATIKSHAYSDAIQQLQANIQVKGLATPEFVTIVENNQYRAQATQQIVQQTLSPLNEFAMDTLVMGCTHFPLLQPLIQQAVGPNVQLIDAGGATVQAVSTQLQQLKLTASDKQIPQHQFYTTGKTEQFVKIANDWLQPAVITAQHVEVTALEEN